ncbi:hypothetical protein Tco_0675626 [Tanacetum coccineum]
MGIPNEHQLKFNSIEDAKSLLQAIEKRFRENDAIKKTQRNLLKQQYENFTASSSEVLDQTFDRLQKLIRQLEIHGENTLSLDDLYNNLKIYEPEVKGTSSSSTKTQNIAFVSPNSTSSTNGEVNTAYGVTTASTQAIVVNSTTIDNLSDAVICAFFARLQETRNRENTRRDVPVETTTSNALIACDGLGRYDWSDQAEEGPTNFALMAYSSTSSNSEVSTNSNCSSSCLENVKILKEQNEQLLKDLRASKIVDKCKTGLGYNAVPPPNTGNFMPPKPDLSFSGLKEFVNEPIVSEPTVKKPVVESSEAKASADKSKVVRNGAPIIEDWVSDSEEEGVPQAKIEKKIVKPSFAKIEFVKSKEQVKSPRKTTIKHGNQNRQNIHAPRGNKRNWNYMMSQRLGSNFEMINKACYVCGSFDHLQYDCDKH